MDALRILALGIVVQLPNTPNVDLQTILPPHKPSQQFQPSFTQPRSEQNQGRASNLSADLFPAFHSIQQTQHSHPTAAALAAPF